MSNLRRKLEELVDALLLDMAGQKSPKTQKVPDFRVSSLPMCPIRNILYQDRGESYSMDFFTSIGTAVHETSQKWLSTGSFQYKIMACWKNEETGEIKGPCHKNELPKSWTKIKYEEITIVYNGLTGHVDLVFEILPDKYIVIDWKTTDLGGKKRKYKNWESFFPSSRSSIIQISSYATLLREIFGINVIAWCLVYVDRGNVIKKSSDYYKVLRQWTPAKHNHMLDMLDRACDNDDRFRRFNKILQQSDDYSPKAVKLLKQMVINRPCVDEESYDEWMNFKFYQGPGGTPEQGVVNGCCELKNFCLKGNKSAYAAIQRKL